MENDNLKVAPPGEGGDFERQLPSTGNHQAVCCQIHNLGHQEFNGQASFSPKCVFIFELEQKMQGGKMDGKPFVISEEFPMYLSKDSKLRAFLGNWRSTPTAPRPMTDDECKDFTLRKVLGQSCTLTVIHKTKGLKTFANIAGIAPPSGPKIPVTYTETPKWITDKIAKQVRPPERQAAQPKPATASSLPITDPNHPDYLPF